MEKGISPVLASVLVVLVVITLSAAFYTFTGQTATQTTEAAEESQQEFQEELYIQPDIEGVSGSQVFLRNGGRKEIGEDDINIFIDDILINHSLSSPIQPQSVGTVQLLDTWKAGLGKKTLRVSGSGVSDSVRVTVENPAGNILEFKFEEVESRETPDTSGNGWDGLLIDRDTGNADGDTPPQHVEGKFGEGLEFDGTDDVVESSGFVINANSITLEAWVRHYSVPSEIQRYVTVPDEGAVIRHEGSVEPGRLHYFTKLDGNLWHLWENGAIENATWHHVSGNWDGTSMRLYMDGEQVHEVTPTDNTLETTTKLLVSRGRETMYGKIDEIRVYNRSYSPDEMYIVNRL